MSNRGLRYGLIATVLTLGITATASMANAEMDPRRQAEILYLLKHDCGSCHGMRLQGGLGPPLSPERFRQWSVEQLVATIIFGRPGTPMPPWRPFLSDQEAHWLALQLKQGIRP